MRTTRNSATNMNKLEFAKRGNPNTPAEALARTWRRTEDSGGVRSAMPARNPNTSVSTGKRNPKKDRDWYVRSNARNPNTPAEALENWRKTKIEMYEAMRQATPKHLPRNLGRIG